jgi:2-polyprenyl-6-hydroxyphenyl methylase/3-demethylubiquinone-9 3-methyltransferase
LKAILGAEYLLGLLPKGTHQYEKFITPAELASSGRSLGLTPIDSKGFDYHPFRNTFSLTRTTSVNYFLSFRKI